MTSLFNTVKSLSVPRYSPRPEPLAIPEPRWNDEPLRCLQVNDEWAAHILGVLLAMDEQDTWLGTEDQVNDAREQVNEIMLALMEDCDMGCCPTPLIQIQADGSVCVSYDGGVTYNPATPAEDPRQGAPQLPPLSGDDGDEKRCSAANNVLGQFKDGILTFEGYFDTSATLIAFVTAVAGFIAALIFAPLAVPILVSILIALLTTIWNAGKTAYSAAFDDEVYGALLCILYCNCESDGTFTADDFAAIRSAISSSFDPIPRDAFTALLSGVDLRGLNNLATIPTGSSASCDSCTDCPDCEVTAFWAASGGDISHVDGCTWEMTSVADAGFYWVYVWFDNPTGSFDATKCGKLVSYELVSGTIDQPNGYNECTTGTLHSSVLDLTGICASQLIFKSSVPFVADFTFEAC